MIKRLWPSLLLVRECSVVQKKNKSKAAVPLPHQLSSLHFAGLFFYSHTNEEITKRSRINENESIREKTAHVAFFLDDFFGTYKW